jgi:hypothetical protein
MSLIINEPENRINNCIHWYENFGEWKSIPANYKSEDGLLTKIFTARSHKTTGGCNKCHTPYRQFKRVSGKRAFRCKCQKTKVFPLNGTHFENFKKSLELITEILYEITCHKNGVSGLYMFRKYALHTKSANQMSLRLADWMHWYLLKQVFITNSTIEIDEVYPKFNTDLGRFYPWKSGKGSERTHGILVLCERGGLSIAIAYNKRKKGEIEKIIKELIPVESDHIIITDENPEYNFLERSGYEHHAVKHRKKEYARDEYNTNLDENLNKTIKKSFEFTHNGIYADYIQLYVSRYAFVHCIRGKGFITIIDDLIDSLPPLNQKVQINFKQKNRLKNQYRDAA